MFYYQDIYVKRYFREKTLMFVFMINFPYLHFRNSKIHECYKIIARFTLYVTIVRYAH